MKNIILASKSPRRKEILSMLNFPFDVIVSDCDEEFNSLLSIEENIKNVAYQKALSVFKNHNDSIVIGADTVVYLDNEILLKPKDKDDARNMLTKLSGKSHYVISGLCVMNKDKVVKTFTKTVVTFKTMTNEEIEEYISTPEPYDKAGGYAVQGLASKFIKEINGDYFNVVGLSISTLYDILKEF
ncbi:Maf family protein [Anaerofustis butyriciformans]|uniref:Maf family protein n=1 Tax=Anaerofustis butyriciformans TaxID=3108533 RepID=UPI002E36D3CA|nr:Maf family protein [Anaerofustis sp. HA2171]